jgi:hypothetical protein
VAKLLRTAYAGVNDTHAQELLAEHEGITISRTTLHRIRREAGIATVRPRRSPHHRRRRERKAQAGMLIQIDGSKHRWLGQTAPWLTLIAGIDDATGMVVAACFREQEDAAGYFHLLRQLVEQWGRPQALYHDRHSIFVRSAKDPDTLAEQLVGKRQPTQVGRAMQQLGIASVTARSPQAKGRIERLFGTLQDRLLVELRLAGVQTLEQANRFLFQRAVWRPRRRPYPRLAGARTGYGPLADLQFRLSAHGCRRRHDSSGQPPPPIGASSPQADLGQNHRRGAGTSRWQSLRLARRSPDRAGSRTP